jgi:hypothetical protein
MKNRKQIMSGVICVLLGAPYSQASINVNDDTQRAAEKLGALKVSEIQFKEGQASVSDSELQDIKKVIDDAKTAGKVSEVSVVAWADREYPPSGQAASKSDIKLADKRADNLKKYLKDKLGVRSVTTYNMAKRPNAIQELFDTRQAKVKGSLETTGAAPTDETGTGFMGFKGKASESLVLVFVK